MILLTEREEIKKKSVIQFRNSVTLLGEIYMRLKINGKHLDILAGPLLQYLELLLDASEEQDIALVTSMVCEIEENIFTSLLCTSNERNNKFFFRFS